MNLVNRKQKEEILNSLVPNKVILLLGPRRVGKTILLRQIISELKDEVLLLNGEDFSTAELLERRTVENYKSILGKHSILFIDEAQKIPNIGDILKLIVDEIKGIRILVSGSSAFDINKITGEPLTGRKKTFHLFPLSEEEFDQIETIQTRNDKLRQRLIYGNYPELIHLKSNSDKTEYLNELVNSYLFKDILAIENIKNSDKIIKLLRLIAFQIGSEVSLLELGTQLAMSKNTVEKYLDLLSKVFIVHKVTGFSRNLRKEITKSSKWYFLDNGIRNLIIANFNSLELRNDIGEIWENYIISERIKYQSYNKIIVNNYFWRTYDQQEIDWIEERNGKLYANEFKWNPKKSVKAPKAWKDNYSDSKFSIVNSVNYKTWIARGEV